MALYFQENASLPLWDRLLQSLMYHFCPAAHIFPLLTNEGKKVSLVEHYSVKIKSNKLQFSQNIKER